MGVEFIPGETYWLRVYRPDRLCSWVLSKVTVSSKIIPSWERMGWVAMWPGSDGPYLMSISSNGL